jgi:hypothetical protein
MSRGTALFGLSTPRFGDSHHGNLDRSSRPLEAQETLNFDSKRKSEQRHELFEGKAKEAVLVTL